VTWLLLDRHFCLEWVPCVIVIVPDRTWLAIYELKGDTLRICINRPGQRRPSDFPSKASEADHGAEWFVLKREKK
jgi:hypothetical protein